MVLPFKRQIAGGELPADGEGTLSGNNPVQFVPTTAKKAQGRCPMARQDLGYLPKQNPCAQCGKPIAAPESTHIARCKFSRHWKHPGAQWLFSWGFLIEGATHMRSAERRVGKECRSRWSPYL